MTWTVLKPGMGGGAAATTLRIWANMGDVWSLNAAPREGATPAVGTLGPLHPPPAARPASDPGLTLGPQLRHL